VNEPVQLNVKIVGKKVVFGEENKFLGKKAANSLIL
jgi:hypothetical protein